MQGFYGQSVPKTILSRLRDSAEANIQKSIWQNCKAKNSLPVSFPKKLDTYSNKSQEKWKQTTQYKDYLFFKNHQNLSNRLFYPLLKQ